MVTSHIIPIRVSEADRRVLEYKARMSGLKLSPYIRHQALHGATLDDVCQRLNRIEKRLDDK